MNCKRCGSELTENGQFCPQCGYSAAITTAAPTQEKSKLDDESRRRKKQQKVKVYFGAIFAVFILVIFFIARSSDMNKTNNGDSADTASDSDASTPSVVTPTNNFPALHFTSSGRLPINFDSLQLGMSVADALSADSNLVNCQEDKNPPSTSDPNITLCPSTHSAREEYDNSLTFSRGRLVLVIRACFINRYGLKLGSLHADVALMNWMHEQEAIRVVERCAVGVGRAAAA